MRVSLASTGLATFLLLAGVAAQNSGDFPDLSTVVEGGASKTTQSAAKTDSTAAATSNPFGEFPSVTAGNGAAPTYPPPTIPPTADAPFMQKSTLPQGTVFICVGAVLGFLLACVIVWRGFLVWTVHRNIRRANAGYVGLAPQGPAARKTGAGIMDGGVGFLKKTPFYGTKATDGSNMSLTPLTAGEPKSRNASGNSALGTAPSKSSLFFSPTAGAGAGGAAAAGAGMPSAGLGVKRGDGYLPSGYYAGNNQPDRSSQRLSTADFDGRQRQSSDYAGAAAAQRGQSPGPARLSRPDLRDTRRESQVRLVSYESRRDSSYGSSAVRLPAPNQSSLSLGTAGGGRAPSAYLEDLFSESPVQQHEQH